MPTEPRDLPDNWREEWLKEDARNQRESIGDIAREAGHFWWWCETHMLLGTAITVIVIAIIAGLIVELM